MRLLALALSFLLALPATAQTEARIGFVQDGQTLFSFAVPDFWSLSSGGEQMVTPPGLDETRAVPQIISIRPMVDPNVWIAFYTPPGVRTLDEGRSYLQEIGQFLANAPQITDDRVRRVAGLPAEVIRGTGRRDGTALQFVVALIDLPGPRIAVGAAVIEAGADAAAFDAVNDVFASFRAGQ